MGLGWPAADALADAAASSPKESNTEMYEAAVNNDEDGICDEDINIAMNAALSEAMRDDEVGGEDVAGGRWVLKCPFHALWIDTLLKEFPEADFICTHRPAHQMVPSWAKFQALSFKMLYDTDSRTDSREFAKNISDSFEEQLAGLEVARRKQEQLGNGQRFFDVHFTDLVKDPKKVVKQIYEHFGHEFTPEYENRIDVFMNHNPRYKHGKPEYSLEEFGLDGDDLRQRFAKFDPSLRVAASPSDAQSSSSSSSSRRRLLEKDLSAFAEFAATDSAVDKDDGGVLLPFDGMTSCENAIPRDSSPRIRDGLRVGEGGDQSNRSTVATPTDLRDERKVRDSRKGSCRDELWEGLQTKVGKQKNLA
eukprot:Selendium_serpulae@DN1664_c0_g1_i1.p1